MKKMLWYEDAVFYGVDIRRFQDSNGDGFGDLPGLTQRLDYLAELGITALWLLPFFDSPLRDNGYDIRDYYRVDPRVGTLDDFITLVGEAHKRDIHLVIDLVMNHTSTEHPWFLAARHDPLSRFRNYYVWIKTPPEETVGGTIFPGEEESVWQYDETAGEYYYHRFYHFQPDLRTANPIVQDEIFKAIDFWMSFGIDGFRIDAAPIMIDPKGFESNRPEEPHRLFQEIHHYAVQRKTDIVILGEANVSMDQMDEFFGGDTEMNMLFNFLLGPHILLALARGSARPIRDYLEQLLEPPANDQWLNFLRNHDEMSLEKMPPEQMNAIFEAFAPDESTRIYNRGIRRRITPILAIGSEDGMHRARQELAYSLLFSAPGTPLIMYGDEIGMGDDLSLPGRNPVRTPMQWNDQKNAGFSTADELIAPVINKGPLGYEQVNVAAQQADKDSFYNFVKKMIAARKDFPEIGLCPVRVVDTEEQDERVLAHIFPPIRENQDVTPPVFFHNLADQPLSASVHLEGPLSEKPAARIGRGKITGHGHGRLSVELPAYGYLWIQA